MTKKDADLIDREIEELIDRLKARNVHPQEIGLGELYRGRETYVVAADKEGAAEACWAVSGALDDEYDIVMKQYRAALK